MPIAELPRPMKMLDFGPEEQRANLCLDERVLPPSKVLTTSRQKLTPAVAHFSHSPLAITFTFLGDPLLIGQVRR